MVKVGGTASAGTTLRALVEQGYGHFALGKLEGSSFPVTGRKEALEVGGDGALALVQSAASNIHAEQSLLLALANHLSLGGKARAVNVAGHKRPCDRCLKVLKASAAPTAPCTRPRSTTTATATSRRRATARRR